MTSGNDEAIWSTPFDASGNTAEIWEPEIAALGGGRMAAVWTQDGNDAIWLRVFGSDGQPEGAAIRVTDANEEGNRPAVALLESGDFVVTYTSLREGVSASIRAQVYASDATATGQKTTLFEDDVHSGVSPNVIGLAGGGFVTIFDTAFGRDGDSFGVFGQLANANGVAQGTDFQINQTTEGFQSFGTPMALSDGGFVVTWRSREVDGSFYAVMMRSYDADGTPRGSEVRVNQYSFRSQDDPDITALPDGRFVIVWESDDQDGSGDAVYARIYGADGLSDTSEFRVNTTTALDQKDPSVATLPDGGFIVVWTHEDSDTDTELRFQRFDTSGRKVGTETILAEGAGLVNAGASLAIDPDGLAGLVWLNTNSGDFVGRTYVSVADWNDVPGPAILGDATDNALFGTDVAERLSGFRGDDILQPRGGDDTVDGGSGADTVSYQDASAAVTVYLQFSGRNVGGGEGRDTLINIENLVGSVFDDRLIGDAFANRIEGLEGNDVIKGKGGADILLGFEGDDKIIGGNDADDIDGGNGRDILIALGGDDILRGDAGDDFAYGGRGADDMSGGTGDDRLRGNIGDDTINGDAGSDDIRGGLNNDLMRGGDGDDFLFGESGNDTLYGDAGNDSLTGGTGRDTFFFGSGSGFDRIKDFQDGFDKVDLSLENFSDYTTEVASLLSETASGVRLNLGGGDVLFLEGVALSELSASDFILS
jgi:Ca2+-binding RTX toxin-like protein